MSSKTLVINRKYNGLFQKKSQQRVLKTYLKKINPPENFRFVSFVTLPLEVPEKQSFTPGTNTYTHGNPVLLLLDLPWKCQFFIIQPHPGIFKCYFSNNLGNSMSSTCHPPTPTPCLGFFGNSPKKIVKSRLLFKKMADFTGKLKQNFKYLQCKVFKMLLMKH